MKGNFTDRRVFKAWNDAMVEKYDVELFHEHPSRVVRYIERKRIRCVFALLASRPGDRVLEVGCGAGHLLVHVPAARAFGLDLSQVLLVKAEKRLGRRGSLVQGDAEQLPFRVGDWDRVYCSEVLEHLVNPAAALAELRRILRLDGVAVVSVPNERLINGLKTLLRKSGLSRVVMRGGAGGYAMPDRMDDEWHLHNFDLRTVLALMPPGLRVVRVEGVPFRWLPLRYVIRCEPETGAASREEGRS